MCMGKSWWDSVCRRPYFNDGNASVNYFSCTNAPAPSPSPSPDISFFVLDGKFLGEGKVELPHTPSHAQMLCNWYSNPQLATLPKCLQ